MRRLTLGCPLPNHQVLDGSPLSWRSGGIIGNVTDGPKSGILIAADPATVERSGFAIGFGAGLSAGCMGNRGRSGIKPEKPLAWHRDQPGLDASSSTNRPPFTMSLTAPMRRRRRAKVRCGTGKTPGR